MARRRGRWAWPVLGWLVSRVGVILIWFLAEQYINGDVRYYWKRMHSLMTGDAGVGVTMPEYPTPVLWMLMVPYLLSGGGWDAFQFAFVAMLVLLDLVFTVLLWRGGEGQVATWFWIVFVVAMGPIAYFRLDLLPAIAVGGSVLALVHGADRASGILLALGAGLKLWPGTLFPATIRGSRRSDRRAIAGFVGTGVALVVAAVLYGGWARLTSPLKWQEGRGLQIESLWATPAMIVRLFQPGAYHVEYSRFQAFEIFGPTTELWLNVASVATVAGYLMIVAGYLLWVRRSYPTLFSRRPHLEDAEQPAGADAAGLFMVAMVLVTLIANKTFSPQYLTWLGAALAALLAVAPVGSRIRRTGGTAAGVTLALAVLTQVIFPIGYPSLTRVDAWTPVVTAVLAVRNLVVLVLGCWVVGQFWPVLTTRLRPRRDRSPASADL